MNQIKNRGWQVTFAGLGINLALGVLYAWSIFKGAIETSIITGGEGAFKWSLQSLGDPYSICLLAFAFSMILAGYVQDKKGPKLTAFIGGLLVAAGFIIISLSNSQAVWILGFGIVAGTGIGFGYSASAPAALKWFPKAKSGLIAGIIVSGFGLASVYISPLGKYLLKTQGIQNTSLIFGIAFFVIVCGLSLFLKNPPKGYNPEAASPDANAKKVATGKDMKPGEMLRTPAFYLIWILYFIGAGAGLMVIGSVSGLAKSSLGELAFLAVAILAVGNAAGRLVAGILSDKIGKKITLAIMLIFQALLMFAAIPLVKGDSAVLVVLLATFLGFNYGSNLSIFPSFTKNYWGIKNFGKNYGLVFTAWGLGGFVLSKISGRINAAYGDYTYAFVIAGILLFVAAGLTLLLKKLQPYEKH